MAYGNYADLDFDLVPLFVHTIRGLDRVYLEWQDSKQQQTKKTPPKVKRG